MDVKTAGSKGGKMTAKRGKKYYQEIQKLSTEARKKKVLASFTVQDALNPVTAESIGRKLEQIELGEAN